MRFTKQISTFIGVAFLFVLLAFTTVAANDIQNIRNYIFINKVLFGEEPMSFRTQSPSKAAAHQLNGNMNSNINDEFFQYLLPSYDYQWSATEYLNLDAPLGMLHEVVDVSMRGHLTNLGQDPVHVVLLIGDLKDIQQRPLDNIILFGTVDPKESVEIEDLMVDFWKEKMSNLLIKALGHKAAAAHIFFLSDSHVDVQFQGIDLHSIIK